MYRKITDSLSSQREFLSSVGNLSNSIKNALYSCANCVGFVTFPYPFLLLFAVKSGGELMVATWKAAAFIRLYIFVNEQGWVVAFENELSYNCSYFQMRYLGTLVTSVTVELAYKSHG